MAIAFTHNERKFRNPVAWAEERLKQLHKVMFNEEIRSAHFAAFHSKSVKKQKTFDRTVQFWTRSAHIYGTYKVRAVVRNCSKS
jgi:hypothetical protein